MKQATRPAVPDFEPSLPNLLAHSVRSFGDKEFLVEADRRLSFAEADARSAELAKGLLALGVGKGTRLGLLMPNGIDWVLVWLAAARIGALTIPLSTLYKTHELAYSLAHTDIQLFVVSPGLVFPDYAPTIPGPALEAVCGPEPDPLLLAVVHPGSDDRPVPTADLLAPIVVGPGTARALQTVLDEDLPLRAPLG